MRAHSTGLSPMSAFKIASPIDAGYRWNRSGYPGPGGAIGDPWSCGSHRAPRLGYLPRPFYALFFARWSSNCASSVDPSRAFVEHDPFEIACITASK